MDCNADFLWGLANFGFASQKIFKRAAEIATEQEKDMSPSELLATLWAFARANRPADDFLDRAFARLPKDIVHYNCQELASLSWALARVTHLSCALSKLHSFVFLSWKDMMSL